MSKPASIRGRCSRRIRRAVHDVDANLPLYDMRTLDQQVDAALTTERVVASLASVFGLLATVLAAVGLYGLMAFNVAEEPAKSACGWRSVRAAEMLHGW